MRQRLFFGTFFLIAAVAIIAYSQNPYFSWIAGLIFSLIISAATWEYLELASASPSKPHKKTGAIAAALYAFSVFLTTQYPRAEILPLVVSWGALLTTFLLCFSSTTRPLTTIALTLFGLFWLPFSLSYMISINSFFPLGHLEDGRWWLLYLLAIKIANDGGALVAGKLLGHHLLAVSISPRKTWEGAIGGLICTLLTSLCFWKFSLHPIAISLSFADSLWLGTILSLLAQFGDLSESLIKRDVGVKDSSSLPGLGGVLDMVDSLVFTAPFLWFYLKLFHA